MIIVQRITDGLFVCIHPEAKVVFYHNNYVFAKRFTSLEEAQKWVETNENHAFFVPVNPPCIFVVFVKDGEETEAVLTTTEEKMANSFAQIFNDWIGKYLDEIPLIPKELKPFINGEKKYNWYSRAYYVRLPLV